ncbi:MAG: hypothetical protein ACRC1K_09805, partial [Planctomycetia bacterium]
MKEPVVPRRTFLAESTALAAAVVVGPSLVLAADAKSEPAVFQSRWDEALDRVWPGAEYWVAPQQDWRVAEGRLECVNLAARRTIDLLTHRRGERPGSFSVSVKLGSLDAARVEGGKGSVGFFVGRRGPLGDVRNSAIHGGGFAVGVRPAASGVGELFVGDGPNGATAAVTLDAAAVELQFAAATVDGRCKATLTARDPADGRVLGRVERTNLPADALFGNVALAVNFASEAGKPKKAVPVGPFGRWWFANWRVGGTAVDHDPAAAFGPILFNQYTLHRRVLKMSVQMPPLGPDDDQTVRLQLKGDAGAWKTVATAAVDPAARNALFRVPEWNDAADASYRLSYTLKRRDGSSTEDHFEGTVRRDPGDADVLSVADISCNAHFAFPNDACVAAIAKLNPDLMAFTGDQYYESTAGFGVDRASPERSLLDVLRKWFLHGWTWRDLTRDRPTICLPDDHDVYHGNLWGEDGAAAPGVDGAAEAVGGYKMSAEFVNAVHRFQTAHHPDSPAAAGARGTTGWFGPLVYGRVGFAILADRQYKTGPAGEVPPTGGGRADHVVDPAFDPATADKPGLQLLGEAQMTFLRQWADDWDGVAMKAAVSQTLFTAMATHHGTKDG